MENEFQGRTLDERNTRIEQKQQEFIRTILTESNITEGLYRRVTNNIRDKLKNEEMVS